MGTADAAELAAAAAGTIGEEGHAVILRSVDPAELLAMVEAQELEVTFCSDGEPSGPFTTRTLLDAFVTAAANVCDQIAERWSQELAA